jgi:hypothetical protein
LSFKHQTQTYYSDMSDIGQSPSSAIALPATGRRRWIVEALSSRFALFYEFRPCPSQDLYAYYQH